MNQFRMPCMMIVAVLASLAALPVNAGDAYLTRVAPLFKKYCAECHAGDDAEGGITLDAYASQAEAVEDGETWLRVLDVIEARSMPPATVRVTAITAL